MPRTCRVSAQQDPWHLRLGTAIAPERCLDRVHNRSASARHRGEERVDPSTPIRKRPFLAAPALSHAVWCRCLKTVLKHRRQARRGLTWPTATDSVRRRSSFFLISSSTTAQKVSSPLQANAFTDNQFLHGTQLTSRIAICVQPAVQRAGWVPRWGHDRAAIGLQKIEQGVWNAYFGILKPGKLHEQHMHIKDECARSKRPMVEPTSSDHFDIDVPDRSHAGTSKRIGTKTIPSLSLRSPATRKPKRS